VSRFVLGVDGGNTKTHYALFDEVGRMRAFLARGTASHEALAGGFDAMEAELGDSLRQLLDPLGLELRDLAAAVFGLAGADTDEQIWTISGRLVHLGLGNFRVVNDAFLGVKAGTSRGIGSCSINGTGTVAAAIGPSGTMVQVGGHGFVSGDEGGGGYLADRVIRAIYDARYRRGPRTALTDLLLQARGLTEVGSLFQQWITKKIPVLMASKAGFEAANAGDVVACELLSAMGRNGAETVLGAVFQAGFPETELVEVVLAGSLYVKADSRLLVEAFEQTVTRVLGDRARFRLLREPPVSGAVLWALEDLGGPPGATIRERVLTELDTKDRIP